MNDHNEQLKIDVRIVFKIINLMIFIYFKATHRFFLIHTPKQYVLN